MGQEQSQHDPKAVTTVIKHSGSGGSLEGAAASSGVNKQKAKLEDIIVVRDVPDASKALTDQTLIKLKNLRITYPVIKNVGGVPIEGIDLTPGLNADPLTEMLLRYQYHLTECAEAVAFDQNALSKRIKEVELFSTSILRTAIDRQKHMDQAFGSIQKFFEIDSLLERICKNMDKTIDLMQDLNALLPEHERFPSEELDIRNQGKSLLLN